MCPSVRQSVVCIWFLDDNLSNINGFSPNLVCALILWRSGLGLLMGKFHQILMDIIVLCFYYHCSIEIPVFNANSVGPDQTHLILVCTFCQLPWFGFPN